MPNTLQTISMVTRELLMHWKNNLVFAQNADRHFASEFAVTGAKVGQVLTIRRHAPFAVRSGPTFSAQDYVERSITLTVDQQKHTDISLSSIERTMSFDDWSRRIGRPQAITLANDVDRIGLALYSQVANSIVSPTDPTQKFRAYLLAAAVLDNNGVPRDGQRAATVGPVENADLVDANKSLFQSSESIAAQYEQGLMGLAGGMTFAMDQNVGMHTTGPRGGASPAVTTAGQTGSSILTTGWTAAAALRLNAGDVIQFAGVYNVNPITRQSTGRLKDFRVTANVSSDASGNATIPIAPAIVISPAEQATVSAAPGAGALITALGTANTAYVQNLVYHKSAFLLAAVPSEQPFSGRASRQSDPDAGLSIRVWQDSNIDTDTHPSRCDILYGWAVGQPEFACRVWSLAA